MNEKKQIDLTFVQCRIMQMYPNTFYDALDEIEDRNGEFAIRPLDEVKEGNASKVHEFLDFIQRQRRDERNATPKRVMG